MRALILERWCVAEKTLACRLACSMPFQAGQFAEFSIPNPPYHDAKGNKRFFSFANAPGSEELWIATRMSDSAFKRSLLSVPRGYRLELRGPMGGFTLPAEQDRPLVFLAGGIGITPVRSMVEHAVNHAHQYRIWVFHANRNLQSIAFFDDFQQWSSEHPTLHYIPVLSSPPDAWPFERGRIHAAMLTKHLRSLDSPIYYLVGPPAMVAATKALLAELHIPLAQIHCEDFFGY